MPTLISGVVLFAAALLAMTGPGESEREPRSGAFALRAATTRTPEAPLVVLLVESLDDPRARYEVERVRSSLPLTANIQVLAFDKGAAEFEVEAARELMMLEVDYRIIDLRAR